jgi:hypothetical protein
MIRAILLVFVGLFVLGYIVSPRHDTTATATAPVSYQRPDSDRQFAASILVYTNNCRMEAMDASPRTQTLWLSIVEQMYEKYGRDSVLRAADAEYRETYFVQGRDYCRWMKDVMNRPPM